MEVQCVVDGDKQGGSNHRKRFVKWESSGTSSNEDAGSLN